MNPQVFRNRVKMFATGLLASTAIYLLYYVYNSFRRAYRFCFGEPERWANHWRVEEAAVIEMSTRVTYFVIWVVVILLSVTATLAAMHLLNRCRKGMLFDGSTAAAIQFFSGLLIVAMISDIIFGSVELYLITLHNPVQVHPIAWSYDPSDFKMIALAVVLFMFGWVMRDAVEIERTNKEFV